MSREPWYCPNCVQTSTRRWNLRVHIQRKHRGIGQPVRNGEWARQHSPFNSAVMGQNKTVDDNPYGECERIQEITDKLVILKTLLCKYLPKEDVAQIIELCCGASLGSGKNIVLENYLESARKWVRFRDSLAMLEQGMLNKTFLRGLFSAFGCAINNPNEKYYSSPDIRDENYIDLRHAYVPEQCQQQEIDPNPSIGMDRRVCAQISKIPTSEISSTRAANTHVSPHWHKGKQQDNLLAGFISSIRIDLISFSTRFMSSSTPPSIRGDPQRLTPP